MHFRGAAPVYPQGAFAFGLFILSASVWMSPSQALEAASGTGTPPQSPAAAEVKKWSGEAELGYVQTAGNTRTTSATFKFSVSHQSPKWHHRIGFDAYGARDKDATTAENYKLEWRTEYQLRDIDYLFGLLRYEDDRFAGYDRRSTEVLGYGYRLFRLDAFNWYVETGFGARQNRFTSGEKVDEGLWRLGTKLTWAISETSDFSQELFVEDGAKNRFTEATTQLKVKVNSSLALKLAYNLKNNSEVPVGTEHTDSKTTVTLSFDF